MNKEKYFIDLSKLSEEQIKALPQVFENSGDKVLPETLSDLISGKITDGFKFLFYSPSGWNQNDYPLKGRTELTYPKFIKLFEGGEGEKDGWIKIESESDLPKEKALYFIANSNPDIIFYSSNMITDLDNLKEMWEDGDITHYQPIQKPLPPKF